MGISRKKSGHPSVEYGINPIETRKKRPAILRKLPYRKCALRISATV